MKKYLNILIALAMCLTLATVVFVNDMTASTEDNIVFTPYPSALFMTVNNTDLPFYDIRVRQALSMAIDYNMIKEVYYGGNAEVLAWPIMPTPEFIDMYTPLEELPESAREFYEFNPERAKFLLAEAQYPLGFKCKVVCNQDQVELLVVIKDYFAQIGVELEIDIKTYAEWESIGTNREYDMMYMHTVDPAIPFEFSRLRPVMPHNYSMVDDPVINETYEAITAANEPEKRQLMKDIVPYILEQGYILVPPVPYTTESLHGIMTGQKLVGYGICRDSIPPGGSSMTYDDTTFSFTNPDCVSEITIERIFIIGGNGEVIYEGPIPGPPGAPPPSEVMKPHETRGIILRVFVPDPTVLPFVYTVEVFWTWTDKEGLPLIGWGERTYSEDHWCGVASHPPVKEVVAKYYIPMENMEQTLVEKIK